MLNVITSPTATWKGAVGLFAGVKLNVAAEAPTVAAAKPSNATAAAAARRAPARSFPLPTMGSIDEGSRIYNRVCAAGTAGATP